MATTALPLDEEDESYGYAILNVPNRQFVSPLGESMAFDSEEELLEAFEPLTNSLGSVSHLRIVKVALDNELDAKAARG
jgi:hypothetical protein